jgi:hypothetical protein
MPQKSTIRRFGLVLGRVSVGVFCIGNWGVFFQQQKRNLTANFLQSILKLAAVKPKNPPNREKTSCLARMPASVYVFPWAQVRSLTLTIHHELSTTPCFRVVQL